MQSKLCNNIIPPKFLQPVKQPPVHQVSVQPANQPRPISVSTPEPNNHNGSTNLTVNVVDDSVTAFWDYQFLFVSQRSETTEPIGLRVVDGSVPPDFPTGTYYLTGPGLFTDDHGSTVHPLDGHGYLRAFIIDRRDVKFMAKYVKTEAQVEEHDPVTDTWRFTHRGPFSVLKAGKKFGNTKVMKNVANTSVLKWGERLMCLWEGGDPYEIESETLDTIGKFDMINDQDRSLGVSEKGGDVLYNVAANFLKPILYGVFNMPPKRLLSHYKIDSKNHRLLTMSCNAEDMLLPRSNFIFYEFDSKFKLLQKQEFNIPDHLMIHDWAFTDTHYILFGNRIKLDMFGAMTAVCGLTPMITALSVNPSKPTTPIYLLPRFPDKSIGDRDWKIPIEAPSQFWVMHVGNAFEGKNVNGDMDFEIHASASSYEWFNFQKLFGYDWRSGKLDPSIMNVKNRECGLLPHLVKVCIKMDADGSFKKCEVESLSDWKKQSDFPVINPSFSGNTNTYIYAGTTSGSRETLPHFPFDSVVKLNVFTKSARLWSAGDRRFIGEPIFVSKGRDEDDGYILVVEYAVSIQICYLVILDSKKIGEVDAVVARFEVPKNFNFPFGFHGFWAQNRD